MTVKTIRFMKDKWYARPHNYQISWAHGLESAVANQSTIVPISMYDEGLGTPSDYEANPRNAAFAEAGEPNCYPESRVDFMYARIRFAMTNAAIETDAIHILRFATMPIFVVFEDQTANDEKSGLDIGEILELQSEATDNQAYPLYNNVDMKEMATDLHVVPTNVPGLTGGTSLEGVAFQKAKYYDALHYYTNGNKLKTVQGGLKWHTLTRRKPTMDYTITQRSKTKSMQEKSFFGVLVYMPSSGDVDQHAVIADTTDIAHLRCDLTVRFNEWNGDFNMKRV